SLSSQSLSVRTTQPGAPGPRHRMRPALTTVATAVFALSHRELARRRESALASLSDTRNADPQCANSRKKAQLCFAVLTARDTARESLEGNSNAWQKQ
ncbi:hypothetical protein PENTCL1PPCAC_29631, partial [Pristionchus entomophagus]